MQSLRRGWKLLQRCLRHPTFAADVGRYILNDLSSAVGRHRYPVRTILIIGLPKSGSTWLHNMLLELPGFNPRYYRALYVRDDAGKLVSVKDEHGRLRTEDTYDNIDAEFFRSAPPWGYSAYKFHAKPSARNLAILNQQAPKWIVTYRDLRDVCVSRYFHFQSNPHNAFYPLYQELSKEEALQHTAGIIRKEFVPWIKGWRDVARQQVDKICEVRYEDLWSDPRMELERILAFYGIEAPEAFFRRALATKISEPEDLKANFESTARFLRKNTARRGGVGGWRDHFSDSLKEEFKAFAGELLIDLGYEKDLNW